ncbi:hypothetical protein [Peribacillus simplex]|uniref:hypothetical protein n=1 Tax=Peribacillus simplex TaxID=1478 RepID=UPI0024C15A65|nr:hypothetical protein [Peribacillus simplex]MDR4928866.1 hypothetical protein [Peribacillus simplex]WHX91340.1 hypothetical protein QNH50_25970 [Peribacillus simplex]
MSRGDPAGASQGRTARGKRVPGAEINGLIVKAIRGKRVGTHINTFSSLDMVSIYLMTKLIGVEGTRLLREKRV